MKYSFMSFSCPELSFEEMLSLAKKIGYDAIETRIGAGHKHGIDSDHRRAVELLKSISYEGYLSGGWFVNI